ncbi:MAG: glutamine synthetase III [Erysipelotrichaceae bacterium]
MSKLTEIFGCKTFDKVKMKNYLSKSVYTKYKAAVRDLSPLDINTANEIADAVKKWAVEMGATHYTHWFQPMVGTTAKKYDSFLDKGEDLEAILRFTGKELIKGEPDASSFPNGGLRSTFEARGYTYWDITSQMFILDDVLYIPTIFVSFNGESLDKKAPLLKSISAVDRYATSIVSVLKPGDVKAVKPTVGLEQEYFLVDAALAKQRADLVYCGKTLIGASAPKGQELDDHYFGPIPERVLAFMSDLNEELWKLGIFVTTEHNEAAPSQFELAPIYGSNNISVDQNLLTMEIMHRVASQHGLMCLLHEKPFANVNGSGKHCNYSLSSNNGINVFSPGNNPKENKVFLVFLSAMIRAVDKYATLIRMAASSVGNDERLGAAEAPPAIVSIFLGEHLERMLREIKSGTIEHTLARNFKPLSNIEDLPCDESDRNRTSPIAFTGNKFEFRMLGSSRSAATLTTTINTIMADELKTIWETIQAEGSDIKVIHNITKATLEKHERVLFSGDGYSDTWVSEAKKRGLANTKTYFDSLSCFSDKSVISVFENMQVFSAKELISRQEISYEELNHTLLIEARTLSKLIHQRVIPDIICQIKEYQPLKNLNLSNLNLMLNEICDNLNNIIELVNKMDQAILKTKEISDSEHTGKYIQETIKPIMLKIREIADKSEVMCDSNIYQIPSYYDLFLSIK